MSPSAKAEKGRVESALTDRIIEPTRTPMTDALVLEIGARHIATGLGEANRGLSVGKAYAMAVEHARRLERERGELIEALETFLASTLVDYHGGDRANCDGCAAVKKARDLLSSLTPPSGRE